MVSADINTSGTVDAGFYAGFVTNVFASTAYQAAGGTTTQQNAWYDSVTITTIPEPATIGMLGLGMLTVLIIRKIQI